MQKCLDPLILHLSQVIWNEKKGKKLFVQRNVVGKKSSLHGKEKKNLSRKGYQKILSLDEGLKWTNNYVGIWYLYLNLCEWGFLKVKGYIN